MSHDPNPEIARRGDADGTEAGGEITDNRAESRYELVNDGETAIAAYDRDGDVIAFTHTAVPPRLQGRGIASRLIAAALADVRRQGLKVRPLCGFVAAYVERHPDTRDLLA